MINIHLCEYRLCSCCRCFVLGFGPLIWWLHKLWFDLSCSAPLFVDVFLAVSCAQYRACDAPLQDICNKYISFTLCVKPADFCSSEEKSHLPNSKITAQTRRALSMSPRLETNNFAKDIIDHITAAVSIPVGWCWECGQKDGKEKETEGVEKRAVSCVPGRHKFFLVRAAGAPQILSEWLNRAFQSCVGQWEGRDREASRVCLAAAGGAFAAPGQ